MSKPSWLFPGAVCAAFALISWAILAPVFNRARENDGHHSSCQSNLKQIWLGVIQYTQDYDEKLPLVSTPKDGWVGGIYPYLKSTQLLQCPSETTPPQPQGKSSSLPFDPRLTGLTDYFYNAQLLGRNQNEVGDIARLILLGDGNDAIENTNASYAKTGIPPAWRTDTNSPAFRHLGGANYAFLDGHTKWLKVENVSDGWNAKKVYFQPKK